MRSYKKLCSHNSTFCTKLIPTLNLCICSDIADQEVDHLVENSDDNRDGKLSIQEIVDHHEIFVGSEATDYGEHLHKFKDEL